MKRSEFSIPGALVPVLGEPRQVKYAFDVANRCRHCRFYNNLHQQIGKCHAGKCARSVMQDDTCDKFKVNNPKFKELVARRSAGL